MTLRYPSDLNFNISDYVTFQAHEYRSNASGEAGPPVGSRIMLYMPNSTPGIANGNSWGTFSFGEGALGRQVGGLAGDIADGVYANEIDVNGVVDRVKSRFESIKDDAGPIMRQLGMNAVATVLPGSAAQIMAVTRGQIYNPNVELAYQGPQQRQFSFEFQFIPKNTGESQQINNIIKEFKKLSSPSNLNNGLLKVPNVWQVTYMSNGSQNPNMNAFKRAALSNVIVKANASSSMHNSFTDGMPVATSLSLQFQEVDIILQEDHDSAPTNQGF